MDAIELLRRDHDLVRSLMARYEDAGVDDVEEKRMVAEEFLRRWAVHERLEEDLFYPAFRGGMPLDQVDVVESRHTEHEAVDSMLDALRELDVGSKEFNSKFHLLHEHLDHHIRMEEEQMFSAAQEHIPNLLGQLGEDMGSLQEALLDDSRDEEREENLSH